jgi:hypothetical protein
MSCTRDTRAQSLVRPIVDKTAEETGVRTARSRLRHEPWLEAWLGKQTVIEGAEEGSGRAEDAVSRDLYQPWIGCAENRRRVPPIRSLCLCL